MPSLQGYKSPFNKFKRLMLLFLIAIVIVVITFVEVDESWVGEYSKYNRHFFKPLDFLLVRPSLSFVLACLRTHSIAQLMPYSIACAVVLAWSAS